MKIVMFTKYFYPHIGGVEKHVECLSNKICEMCKSNIEISIITHKYYDGIKSFENRKGVKIYRFRYPKIKYIGLLNIWLWLFKNINIVKEADIIHIHDVFIWYLPLRLIYPRKKVFVTFHGYESYPIKPKALIIRKIAERLSNGNICIGAFMKKWYKTKPTIVSYGAVDGSKFKESKCKLKYDAVFSSRLDNQTGILNYLSAVKLLREWGNKFDFVVLGDGIYKKDIEKHAECKGFIDDPSKYYKLSKFAFVSRYLAILEAISCKKLVFAVYDNPIKKDYLNMSAFRKWIVVESDPKKLAEKVQYYIKNPKESDKLVDDAYKWVKYQTWEKLAINYLKLWGIEKMYLLS